MGLLWPNKGLLKKWCVQWFQNQPKSKATQKKLSPLLTLSVSAEGCFSNKLEPLITNFMFLERRNAQKRLFSPFLILEIKNNYFLSYGILTEIFRIFCRKMRATSCAEIQLLSFCICRKVNKKVSCPKLLVFLMRLKKPPKLQDGVVSEK